MKTIKSVLFLTLCVIALLAVCVSCDKVSIVDDDDIFLNLTEEFSWIEYELRKDDTLHKLSSQFKVSYSDIHLEWTDEGEPPKYAKIPSMNGISHTVENSDTVSMLARRYHVPQEVIMDANNIENDIIDEGKRIFIPNPYIYQDFSDASRLNERFIYPIKSSSITRPFGWQYDTVTGRHIFHPGIDLRVETSTPVRAVIRGMVCAAGKNKTHGLYVILAHDYGYYSLYSNLSDVSVKKGSYIRQGNIIGEAGDTGNDGSEPHVHFGIFRGYNALDIHSLLNKEQYILDESSGAFVRINDDEYEFDDNEGYVVLTINSGDGKAIRIIGYMGRETNVRIPGTLNGLPVVEIGDGAFFERGLTRVTIPEGIISIGNEAFDLNNLKRITLPNSVTSIGHKSFAHNKLTNVIIPSSIIAIGGWAFTENKLRSVTIPSSVVSIGYGAFAENKLRSVTIPSSVTVIEGSVFANNKLRSVTIPGSVASIGDGAFAWNKIIRIMISTDVTLGKGVFPHKKNIIEGVKDIFKQIRARESIIFDDWERKGAFELQFDDFYTTNGSKAGMYIYGNNTWRIE